MSYILDALKKSDQQRQHAKAPTLLSTHATPAAASSRRVAVNLWWALALIGIACAGFGLQRARRAAAANV